jgi:hypothetical protein
MVTPHNLQFNKKGALPRPLVHFPNFNLLQHTTILRGIDNDHLKADH